MRIIEFRPSCGSGRRLGSFDAEVAPGVRANDLSLIQKGDGSYRVYSSNVRFDIAVANELAQAAVSAEAVALNSITELKPFDLEETFRQNFDDYLQYLPQPVDVESAFNVAGGADEAKAWLAERGIPVGEHPPKLIAYAIDEPEDDSHDVFRVTDDEPDHIAIPLYEEGKFVDLVCVHTGNPKSYNPICHRAKWMGAANTRAPVVRVYANPLDWLLNECRGVVSLQFQCLDHYRDLAGAGRIECNDVELATEIWDRAFNAEKKALGKFVIDGDPKEITRYFERRETEMARHRIRDGLPVKASNNLFDLYRNADRAALPVPANDNDARADSRFTLTWFDNIEADKPKAWVIKNVLGEGEHTIISGLPGTGKSVIAADGACHVAAGMEWFGRKTTQGLVLFVAAERKALTERRMMAFRKHHGVKDVPLLVLGGRLDLTSSLADAKALADVVQQAERDCGQKCVWIIIDTLTRVFGAGDQNTSKDMGRFIQACDELIRLTGAHVTVVHHTAWSGERGKGAIDLDGAVDASFMVVKNSGTYTLKCDGANDGDEGTIATFTMQSIELAKDEDGEPTTAPVVVPGESAAAKMVATGHAKQVLDVLLQAVSDDGIKPEGSDFPDGSVVVTEKTWRAAYYESQSAVAGETVRKRFRRAKEDLLAQGRVKQVGRWYWPG